MGILAAGYISSHLNRKKSLLLLATMSLLGSLICLGASIFSAISWGGTIGTAISGFSIYSMPYLSICIMCEIITYSKLRILLCLSLLTFCIGKMLIFFLTSIIKEAYQHPNSVDLHLILYLLLPISVLQLFCAYKIDESPRVMIEADVVKAEELLKKILYINEIES